MRMHSRVCAAYNNPIRDALFTAFLDNPPPWIGHDHHILKYLTTYRDELLAAVTEAELEMVHNVQYTVEVQLDELEEADRNVIQQICDIITTKNSLPTLQ